MNRIPNTGFSANAGLGLSMLTQDQIYQIHLSAVEVLSTIGIRMDSKQALKVFKDNGANVDFDTRVVKIPQYMIEEAIRTTPSQFLLRGRTEEADFLCGDRRTAFIPFGQGVNVIDLHTREVRDSLKQDMIDIAKVTDELSEMDMIIDAVAANDVPSSVGALYSLMEILDNTSKPAIVAMEDARCMEVYVEMASILAGGYDKIPEYPTFMGGCCPVSPLTYSEEVGDGLVLLAKAGLPIMILSMALGGATSPYQIAGTLTIHNAELLAGITLTQLVRPGLPLLYGSSTALIDIQRMTCTVGCPGMALISAAVAQLGKFYQIPTFVAGG